MYEGAFGRLIMQPLHGFPKYNHITGGIVNLSVGAKTIEDL